jgi:nucleoside 2-deoxyribosyltransferase
MKVYLAGPDVFRPDARVWAEEARALCTACGVEALVPLDGGASTAAGIYAQNIAMIRAADAVAANLEAFRGAEPDSGTCFEVGFALALGKPVVGYLPDRESIVERVARWQDAPLRKEAGCNYDANGWLVEDFGLPLNLMLAVPARVVQGGLRNALEMLRGDAQA